MQWEESETRFPCFDAFMNSVALTPSETRKLCNDVKNEKWETEVRLKLQSSKYVTSYQLTPNIYIYTANQLLKIDYLYDHFPFRIIEVFFFLGYECDFKHTTTFTFTWVLKTVLNIETEIFGNIYKTNPNLVTSEFHTYRFLCTSHNCIIEVVIVAVCETFFEYALTSCLNITLVAHMLNICMYMCVYIIFFKREALIVLL